jgi:hypothetical protein
MTNDEYPHFKDFAEIDSGPLEGKKKKITEILGKDLLILSFQIKKSKINDGDYATIQFEISDEKYIVFTASRPLMEQLERYKEKLPFHATIVHRYKYYTMT